MSAALCTETSSQQTSWFDDKTVQILDFGIARINTSTLTHAGTLLGTPNYMAPEQYRAQPADARSDVFSAGVLLYQLLTGTNPFFADSPATTMRRILKEDPVDPSRLTAKSPRSLDGVTRRAIAKDPDARFQTAADFALALKNAFDSRAAPDNDATLSQEVAASFEKPELHMPALLKNAIRFADKKRLVWGLGIFACMAAAVALLVTPRSIQKPPDARPAPIAPVQKPAGAARPALDRQRLDAVLAAIPCAHLQANVDEAGRVALMGYLRPEDLPKVTAAIGALSGVAGVTSTAETISWPYCEVLTLTRPFDRELQLGLPEPLLRPKQHSFGYKQGENLVIGIAVPASDSYVYVDYFQQDGSVVHLFPNSKNQHRPYPANARFSIGEAVLGGKQWSIQAPFGREMIAMVAASQPLFKELNPEVENAADYLGKLRAVFESVDKQGLTADHFYIDTSPVEPTQPAVKIP